MICFMHKFLAGWQFAMLPEWEMFRNVRSYFVISIKNCCCKIERYRPFSSDDVHVSTICSIPFGKAFSRRSVCEYLSTKQGDPLAFIKKQKRTQFFHI